MLTLLAQAWRSWKNAKGVAAFSILALAIGIGSTVAVFTVVYAVLLKPLPFAHGERYVLFYAANPKDDPHRMSGSNDQDLREYQSRLRSFDVFGWFTVMGDFNLTSPGTPEHLHGVSVTPQLVKDLGVPLQQGRWFRSAEQEPAGSAAVVISDALWRRLGADGAIIGKSIGLNGRSYTVTGIAPPSFRLVQMGAGIWLAPEDVWLPIPPSVPGKPDTRGLYIAYARLRPGVSLSAAAAEARAVAASIARERPAAHSEYTARIMSLQDTVGLEVRSPLLLLMAASGLLLVITCANVSGLLVARSVERARETAVRVALGAAQWQLGVQYFFEGLVVACAGCALAIALAYALIRIILALARSYLPRAHDIQINLQVLAFAIAVAILSAVLASFAPLWQAFRTQPNEALSNGVRASAGLRSRRLSRLLVGSEIALAFTLLCCASLLISELRSILSQSPGFNPEHLLTFQMDAAMHSESSQALHAYQQQVLTGLRQIPGVQDVSISYQMPLKGCCFFTSMVSDQMAAAGSHRPQTINFNSVSASYFSTLGLQLLQGRFLNNHDNTEHPVHVVINQAAAARFFPRGRVLDQIGHTPDEHGDALQIVGVVRNVRNDKLGEEPAPEVYFLDAVAPPDPSHLAIRSRLGVEALLKQVRRVIQRINPGQAIYDVATMREVVQSSITIQRGTSALSGFFALASLLMATLGVYGVMAYFVRQRTVEMGTRLALGAMPGTLLRFVIRNGWMLTAWGIAAGLVLTAGGSWLMVQQFQLVHFRLLPLVTPAVALLLLSTVASFFPAWRATTIAPMTAIREQPENMWSSTRRGWSVLIESLSPASFGGADASSRPGPSVTRQATLLTEFVDAARQADSFGNAIAAALAKLCEQLDAEWSALLEDDGSGVFRAVASAPVGLPPLQLSQEGFLAHRLRSYPLPLPISHADLAAWKRWSQLQRPGYTPELSSLESAKLRMAVPLATRRENLGLLLLGPKNNGHNYSSFDKQALRACADQLSLMLENGRLTHRIVEQEKLRRDVALAVEVQRRLLPSISPTSSIGEFAAYTLPARSVGGDYYDFLQVGDHRVGIALADIAGKGVAAALLMSVVQASLRVLSSQENLSLPDLAAQLNRYLHRSTGASSYATFFYAQVNEETRELRYVNAGHNPPFLLRNGASVVEPLATGGMIIGMFPQAAYEEGSVALRSGDILIVFTDGVTEALNPMEEEFGEERLTQLLRTLAGLPVQEISSRIAAALRAWIGTADQHDDLTFVVLKVD